MDRPNVKPPEGYKVTYGGDIVIERGDYIWDCVEKRWAYVFGHIAALAGQTVPNDGTVAKAL